MTSIAFSASRIDPLTREPLAHALARVEHPDTEWVSLSMAEINHFRTMAQAVIDAGWVPSE